MKKVFIIGKGEQYINAAERFIKYCYPDLWQTQAIRTFLLPSSRDKIALYESICKYVESETSPANLMNSVVIAEKNEHSNPLLKEDEDLSSLFAMLILTFPEIKWIFSEDIINKKGLDGSSTLFDPYGLRCGIFESMKESKGHSNEEKLYFPFRDRLAAAIDEELSYAFLHGYLAYRLGFKCYLITTDAAMEELFGPTSSEKVSMTFEDMYLNFPDEKRDYLSCLRERDKDGNFPGLKKVERRIFVTVGHDNKNKPAPCKGEKDCCKKYIRDELGKKYYEVNKPIGGMYDILDKSKLLEKYFNHRKEELNKYQLRNDGDAGGHSAPGRLLLIATNLIDRADKIANEAQTVQECIHGASLALHAQELLGGRTPTTSLEAIALRHKLEVKAECMFYGIGCNINVKDRLKEIKLEVNAVSEWFKSRKSSSLNAQISIVTGIMRIFDEFGQFDEVQECAKYLRIINRKWSLKQQGVEGFLAHVFYPFRAYVEKLVGSFPLFFVAIIAWPMFFGVFNYLFRIPYNFYDDKSKAVHLWNYILNSFVTFFGLQPNSTPETPFGAFLSIMLILLGFVHLGTFISHLYTLITRK